MIAWLLALHPASAADPVAVEVLVPPAPAQALAGARPIEAMGWRSTRVDGRLHDHKPYVTVVDGPEGATPETRCACTPALSCHVAEGGAVRVVLDARATVDGPRLGRCEVGDETWTVTGVTGPLPDPWEILPGVWAIPVRSGAASLPSAPLSAVRKAKHWTATPPCRLAPQPKGAAVVVLDALPEGGAPVPCIAGRDGAWSVLAVPFLGLGEAPPASAFAPDASAAGAGVPGEAGTPGPPAPDGEERGDADALRDQDGVPVPP